MGTRTNAGAGNMDPEKEMQGALLKVLWKGFLLQGKECRAVAAV